MTLPRTPRHKRARAHRRDIGRPRVVPVPRILAVALVATAATCIPDDPAPPRQDHPDTTATALAPDTAVAAAVPDAAPDTTPPIPPPVLDRETALVLASMPLSCVDRPHAIPDNRSGYLTQVTFTRRPGFEEDRAFYGCSDWHSAVNSTWAMVRVMKELPELPVSPLIREKLEAHLTESAMAGELDYLTKDPVFERPYGWAWLLLLHAELVSWGDPDAAEWAGHMEPVVDLLSERMADYIGGLERPVRSGTHRNTAFAISMSLRAAAMVRRPSLARTLGSAAARLFADDRKCPVDREPGGSDFLSPCLEEAALMASLMEQGAYVQWLDSLLPPIDSDDFAPLRQSALSDSTRRFRMSMNMESPAAEMAEALSAVVGASRGAVDSLRRAMGGMAVGADTPGITMRGTSGGGGPGFVLGSARLSQGARSHLIGLAFTRAEAMLRIAEALPAGDPRIARLRELAAQHGHTGLETMFDVGYTGSHWIGSFALKYLVESGKHPLP